jgi:hypothetical protein
VEHMNNKAPASFVQAGCVLVKVDEQAGMAE